MVRFDLEAYQVFLIYYGDYGAEAGTIMRIDKYISVTGLYPRRETARLIAAGRITINGTGCAAGAIVEPGDIVAVDGVTVTPDRGNASIWP